MIAWAGLRREPFRLLFPLGTLFGLIGVNHWALYAAGLSAAYSGPFHAGMQMGYMLGFILGFLLTALPRFAAADPATPFELAVILGVFAAYPVALALGWWMAAHALYAALLAALACFAGRRVAARRAGPGPPTEFLWVLWAVLFGIGGSGLTMAAQTGWLPARWLAVGRPMATQGFLLAIVLGIGGFMAPRLMGRGYPTAPAGATPAAVGRMRRRRAGLHTGAALLLGGSFFLEGAGALAGAYGLRAAVVTAELLWTAQFIRPPVSRERYVRLLWVSLWCLAVGLWAAALWPRYRVAALHVVFLGGFSLMTFAVATMVVLSHTGAAHRLQRRLWVLDAVGIGVAGAILARLAAEARPEWFFPLLGLAAAWWSLAGVSWLAFALAHVGRDVPPEAFAQLHEVAKQRLAAGA